MASVYTDMVNFAAYKKKITYQDANKLAANDDYLNTIAGSLTKIGSFTRSMADASGTQDVTGIGFTPKGIDLFAFDTDNNARPCWGIDDGTNHYVMYGGSTAWTFFNLTNISIVCYQGGSPEKYYTGYVSAWITDGFRITWVRVSTPTGTINISYRAYR